MPETDGKLALMLHKINNNLARVRQLFSLQFTDNRLDISRGGMTYLEKIVIFENEDNKIKLDTIILYINTEIILEIDIHFIKQLIPGSVSHDPIGKYTTYNLNLEQFGIKFLLCVYHRVEIGLKLTDGTQITKEQNIHLYGKQILLTKNETRLLYNNRFIDTIFQLVKRSKLLVDKRTFGEMETNIDISDYGYANGFFIETNNNIKINKISISIDDDDCFVYDRDQLEHYCEKYENMIYVSLSDDKNVWSKDIFEGLFFSADLNYIKIKITYLNETEIPSSELNYIHTYTLISNKLFYKNGMYGIRYNL